MLQHFEITKRATFFLGSSALSVWAIILIEGANRHLFPFAVAAVVLCACASTRGVFDLLFQTVRDERRVSNFDDPAIRIERRGKGYELSFFCAATVITIAGLLMSFIAPGYSALFAIASIMICVAYCVGEGLTYYLLAAGTSDVSSAAHARATLFVKAVHPEFAFHFSGPDQLTPMHVAMWLPYLESLNKPFFVIVRERKHLDAVSALTKFPVILCGHRSLLRSVVTKQTKVIFYANNGMKNRDVLDDFPNATHVQLLHGDSDKPPSFNPVSKAFDKLFVAGQMGVDRYANNNVIIPLEKFEIVGRPQVAAIVGKTTPRPDKKTIVAYMPTWAGYHEDSKFSSLSVAAVIINDLLESESPTHVLFKPHPLSYRDALSSTYLEQVKAVIDRPRNNGNTAELLPIQFDAFDIYNRSNVLISDISSVIIDYLYSGKPYVVTNPQGWTASEFDKYPSAKGGYILSAKGDDAATLVTLASGADPLHEARLAVRSYAFGDIHLPPGQAFREACLKLINGDAIR